MEDARCKKVHAFMDGMRRGDVHPLCKFHKRQGENEFHGGARKFRNLAEAGGYSFTICRSCWMNLPVSMQVEAEISGVISE